MYLQARIDARFPRDKWRKCWPWLSASTSSTSTDLLEQVKAATEGGSAVCAVVAGAVANKMKDVLTTSLEIARAAGSLAITSLS
jgi:hypothetical protein